MAAESVRVGHERVEPDEIGGERRIHVRPRGRVERQRSGQEVEPEVEATAVPDEVLQLLVGLGVAEAGVDVDDDDLGHRQADRTGDLPGQPFGHERARALARAAELHDIQPIVIRLDEPGQRATLAQRRDVAGRRDMAHIGHRAGV